MIDPTDRGRATSWWDAVVAPVIPWARPYGAANVDARLRPSSGGSRRMTHPFLQDIVYPKLPDVTLNFDDDRLRKIVPVVGKTQGGSFLARYPEVDADVVITEVWRGDGQVSTTIELFRLFRMYQTEILPAGRYLGWQPRDRSPHNYFVELVDVRLGQAEDYHAEALGHRDPYVMRESLIVQFKLIADAKGAALVLVGEGD